MRQLEFIILISVLVNTLLMVISKKPQLMIVTVILFGVLGILHLIELNMFQREQKKRVEEFEKMITKRKRATRKTVKETTNIVPELYDLLKKSL